MTVGHFITMEGGEGTGKSTQIRHVINRLQGIGIEAVATREPGGSAGAERIRALLLEEGQARFDPLTETLLFFAARNDHLDHVIRPALSAGKWVISDRFSDSTRVYQGRMGRVDASVLDVLDEIVVGKTEPSLTLVLDLPAEIGLERAKARRGERAADGFEAESLAFHQALRERYLDLGRLFPERCVIIDASGSIEDVSARIWDCVRTRFALQDRIARRG
jgi:dTMP kinase